MVLKLSKFKLIMEVLRMQATKPKKATWEFTTNKAHNNNDTNENVEYRWLPHLKDAVPPAGQGKRISTYTVALEGWRRGLKLKFYSVFEDGNKLKVRYSLENKHRVHHFSLSMGDKVSDKAFKICDDKDLTKQYLAKENVPVPVGKMFEEDASVKEIIAYAKELGFPLVVKPTDGNAGRGVFANIQDMKSFKEIVFHVREKLEFPNIIVEKYYPGEEFRIYVIENQVLGAMNRRPANVVGDGKHTIRQLIERKNNIRKMNPHLTSRLIKIDKEIEDLLARVGYTLDTVLDQGEFVYLREKSNLSTGGEAIDVTEQLTPELKQIAINAGKAIPGLAHYGVDMIVDKENNTGVILEVNARPGLGGHLFPIQGQPRDFAKKIIDYYFPETAHKNRSLLYFDFDSVIEPIVRRSASYVEVLPPPEGKLYGKKLVVSGDYHRPRFRRWIRRQAHKNYLHGFTDLLENNDVVIVVAGTDQKIVDNFKNICFAGPEGEKVSHVDEEEWNEPLLIGFETKRDYNLSRKEIQELIQEKDQIERERDILRKNYNNIRSSRAWRMTFPIRFILYNIKQFIRSFKHKKR